MQSLIVIVSLLFIGILQPGSSQESDAEGRLQACEKLLNDINRQINEFGARLTEVKSTLGSIQGKKELEDMSQSLDQSNAYVTETAQETYNKYRGAPEQYCKTKSGYRSLQKVYNKLEGIYNKMGVITERSKKAGDKTENMISQIGEQIDVFTDLHSRTSSLLENATHINAEDRQVFTTTLKDLQSKVRDNIKPSYAVYSSNPTKYRNNYTSVKRIQDQVNTASRKLQDIYDVADPTAVKSLFHGLEVRVENFGGKISDIGRIINGSNRMTRDCKQKLTQKLNKKKAAIKEAEDVYWRYSKSKGKFVSDNTVRAVQEIKSAMDTIDRRYKSLLKFETKLKKFISPKNGIRRGSLKQPKRARTLKANGNFLGRMNKSRFGRPVKRPNVRSGRSVPDHAADTLTAETSNKSTQQLYFTLSDTVDKAMQRYQEVEALLDDHNDKGYKKGERQHIYKTIEHAQTMVEQYKGTNEFNSSDRTVIATEITLTKGQITLLNAYELAIKQHLNIAPHNNRSSLRSTEAKIEAKTGLSGAAIVGITILVVCCISVCALFVAVVLVYRNRRPGKEEDAMSVHSAVSGSQAKKAGSKGSHHSSSRGSHKGSVKGSTGGSKHSCINTRLLASDAESDHEI